MTPTETINLFKTPILDFMYGKVIQKLLLGLAATADETLAAKRCLDTLEQTELRAVFLATYPTIRLTPAELVGANGLVSIKNGLLPYHLVVIRALDELKLRIPPETVNMLRDHFKKESTEYYVAVCVWLVQAMVLLESGEI